MIIRLTVLAFAFLGMTAADIALTAPGSTEAASAAVATGSLGTDAGQTNFTVILKNREFPLKMRMTMHPCDLAACVDI
jgi:hypothetical protein